MGAKATVFDIASPVDIHAPGALINGADAIAPMIVVGVTSARPPEYGNAKFPKRFNGLLAIALDVGNWRFLADPQTTVDAGPEMLGKMAVKLRTHDANLRVRAHDKLLCG